MTECLVYLEGQRQNPSWCFAVSIINEIPASAATLAHWVVLSPVGLNIAGSSWPVPHSLSVNVLTPKWRNIMISLCCHFNWEYVGSGRIGNGGVGTCSCQEMQNLCSWNNRSVNKKEQHLSLAMMLLESWLIFCSSLCCLSLSVMYMCVHFMLRTIIFEHFLYFQLLSNTFIFFYLFFSYHITHLLYLSFFFSSSSISL